MESHSLGSLVGDLATVAGLILLASLFVAAEIALISLRDSQIRQLSTQGRRGARVALLAQNPNRFLAAAQVGVTVCGFLSAALGAEKLGAYIIPWLEDRGVAETEYNYFISWRDISNCIFLACIWGVSTKAPCTISH